MRVGKVLHTHTHTRTASGSGSVRLGAKISMRIVCVCVVLECCKQIMLALTRQTPQSLDPAPAPASSSRSSYNSSCELPDGGATVRLLWQLLQTAGQ